MTWSGGHSGTRPTRRTSRAVEASIAERVFFSISEHADGDRRGPVSIRRRLKTRLAETSPTLPSDSILPSAFAACMPRKTLLQIDPCSGLIGHSVMPPAHRRMVVRNGDSLQASTTQGQHCSGANTAQGPTLLRGRHYSGADTTQGPTLLTANTTKGQHYSGANTTLGAGTCRNERLLRLCCLRRLECRQVHSSRGLHTAEAYIPAEAYTQIHRGMFTCVHMPWAHGASACTCAGVCMYGCRWRK